MRKHFFYTLTLFMLTLSVQAQVQIQQYATGFVRPVSIAAPANDDRLFIVEQRGTIRVIDTETGTVKPGFFLDIRSRVFDTGNEQGLLGLVFDPDFANNGYFYVNYTKDDVTDGDTRISRFHVDAATPNTADPASELIIMEIAQPYSNHNGGDILIGPDGYMYIPTGDGGAAGDPQSNAQNPLSRLGKMLRIDVRNASTSQPYSIPADNPFAGANPADTLPEIWSLGLRNPWRCSFDALTHDLWIADVGQGDWEEIDMETPNSGGRNYGWRCYEGNVQYDPSVNCSSPPYTSPVYVYSHSVGLSVTGGYVYRGSEFPDIYGKYIFADYVGNFISAPWWAMAPNGVGGWTATQQTVNQNNISTFGVDARNELYAANLSTGVIYRVGGYCLTHPATPPTVTFDGSYLGTLATANYYEWQLNGNPVSGANATSFQPVSNGTYTLYIQDTNGCSTISEPLEVSTVSTQWAAQSGGFALRLMPNPANEQVNIKLTGNLQSSDNQITVCNSIGQIVHSEQTSASQLSLNTAAWADGVYMIRWQTASGEQIVRKLSVAH